MAHFPDLSPYEYAGVALDVVNVGWLDAAVPFPIRSDPWPHLAALMRWAGMARVNQMRGNHDCEFCADRDLDGSAEIWVPAPGGRAIFAAPVLVLHYIDRHLYDPPAAFAEAVAATATREDPLDQSEANARMHAARRLVAIESVGDTTFRLPVGASTRIEVSGTPGCPIAVTALGSVAHVAPDAIGSDGRAVIAVGPIAAGLAGVKVASKGCEIIYIMIGE